MIKNDKETCWQSGLTHHHHQQHHPPRAAMLLSSVHSSSSSLHSKVNPFSSLILDVLLTLLIISLSCFANTCHASCNKLDRDSLLSFSRNIGSPSAPLIWNASVDCCQWEGIFCDTNDRVISLLLPSRGLVGSISPSVANLSYLSQLNLSRNLLTGPLPDGFFISLNRLQIIDLSYNRLSGQLPPSDKFPTTIQTVDFSSNKFNGTIQFTFLQQATSLVTFNISNNSFFGSIPLFICSISPTIRVLDFSFNGFHGSILPDVGNCPSLETLRAGFNALYGPLPCNIYRVLTLQELSLPGNKLNGSISEEIARLKNLRILALYANEFTGTIPPEIGMLSNLEGLLLHINKLHGTLPPSLTNCTRLKQLILRVNSFTGELSTFDFSKLTQLGTVDLGNNFFSGSLPLRLFLCKSLTAVRLATNMLSGEIPYQIQTLQSLSFFSVSNNSLTNITSAIRILTGCKNLSAAMLSKNFYNESLPGDDSLVDSQAFQNLQILGLGGCYLSGQVPSWLTKLQMLEVIDLSVNKLTGTIPGWLGTLPNLFYLDLSQNLLSGKFPIELTKFPRLVNPKSADHFESYLELPVFGKPDNVTASSNQYNQLSNLPPAIFLNVNNLSGTIPIEIGQLKYIHVLDLSNNNFSGTIPNTISYLTNLEKLDLSHNHFSGEIPASLRNLHFLSSFSVASNNLQGPIPTGGQFETFPNSSFEGNSGLCGRFLHPCSDQAATANPSATRKSQKRKIVIGLILGICFGIGFTLSVVAFWIFSKRRILPKGDAAKIDPDADFNSNSNPGLSTEFGQDTNIVILFPNNTKGIKDLTMSELLNATDNFNQANIIGCGGFGLVYKATLTNGTQLAIKKLSGDMGLMEREFKAEVEALSTAQHENLVALQGYCVHDACRLLIYSYMENGSLDYWLHEKPDGAALLDWPTRLKIVQGASCGLAYMHQICEPHIVHRDIKSSNILLDGKFKAHVADFGLSRLILPYRTHVTTELVGTLGYIPPEYSQSWMATLRGDIYSFGVVMLELLTGKRPMEMFKPKVSRELVPWVQQMRNDGKQDEIFDPLLRGKGFEEEMMQVLDVACLCVNQNPFKRPTIADVVDWLHEIGSPKEG